MSKEAILAAESAIKSAAALFQGTGDIEGAVAAAQRFYQGISALSGVDPAQVEAQEAAQRQQTAQSTMQQAQAQVQQQMGGQVVRDLSSEEARWKDALQNNPGDWYNNVGDQRATSGGGKGPDFKFKDDNADVKALFLNGKYGPAPAWVFEALNLPFPGGGPAPQAAPAQPAPAAPAAPAQQAPVPF